MLKTTMLVFGLMLMSFSVLDANEPVSTIGDTATTTCTSNGCNVIVNQTPSDWSMTIDCDGGGGAVSYNGSGQYGGTICGNVAPATIISP